VEAHGAEEPGQKSGADTRTAVGALVFILLLVALGTLFVRALSASFPDDPSFAVPGQQTRQLRAGVYVVYVSLPNGAGGDRLPTRIRVTGPDDRPVAVDTGARAPDLSEPGEGGAAYRDQGRFTVPGGGTYQVSVTGIDDGYRAIVTAPRSLWRQWWPVLLAAAAGLAVPFLVAGVGFVAGRRDRRDRQAQRGREADKPR
jgi:hypothetical protein